MGPLRCPCQNRGICSDAQQTVQCKCPADYEGSHCETYLKRTPTPPQSAAPAYIIVPVLLIIVVALAGAAVYVFFFRRSAEPSKRPSILLKAGSMKYRPTPSKVWLQQWIRF